MATLPQRLWTSDRCGHQSLEFAILFNDQNPHTSTSTLVQIPFRIQSRNPFLSRKNSEPNPTHLLDDGTSILKRGIATMPASIHRTIARYSLPSNWHRPSELLPYQSQSFVDLSSWMLKGFIPTSNLNSERIPFLQNTSTTSQTPSGPSIPMVYYATSDASMFRTPAISDYVFFSTRTTTLLQVISVRRRPYIKSVCNTIGPDFQSTSKTTENCAPLVPAPNLCATNPTDFSSNFQFLRSLGIPYPWIS